MRLSCLTLVAATAAALTGFAAAQSFAVPAATPRSSIKVERITPDMMFEICGFEKQDQPFFLDSEYRRAIAELGDKVARGDPYAPETERIAGIKAALEECRENDLNKRHAKRAMRSCKALIREHKAASARAEAVYEGGYTPRREVMDWGERFRAPVEKCLKSLNCRVDNKKDEQEALEVYRLIVDEMQGWVLDVKGLERMQICGSTIRDVRNWCRVESRPDADNIISVRDDCKNPHDLMLTIKLLQNIRIRTFPQADAGGAVGGGGR